MSEPQPALAFVEPARALTDRVADALREAILVGALRGGERLSVPKMARQMGVSRTPVKESLLILERDGLVATRPRLGAEVLIGTEADLADMLDIREALDGMTARLAAERMGAAEKRALLSLIEAEDRALQESDLDRHVELDLAFHRRIHDGSRNERLIKALVALEWQIRLLMRQTSKEPGFAGKAVMRDHRAIAEAVGKGDPDAAEKAARAHVQRIRRFCSSIARDKASKAPAHGSARKVSAKSAGRRTT